MMRKYFILVLVLSYVSGVKAQAYQVQCTTKKIKDLTYEVHVALTVKQPWHVYSQFTPAGGPMPTSFRFRSNPMLVMDGPTREVGTMVKRREKVIDVDVQFFLGNVDFVQKVKLKRKIKTSVGGEISFMVCNDKECSPPITQQFSVELNG